MIQSPYRPWVQVRSGTFRPKRLTKPGQHRLILWLISSTLLLITGGFLQDAVQNNSLLGILFGGSWVVTILMNAIFIDYLLRQNIHSGRVNMGR